SFTILTEDEGQISFRDLIEGQTFHEQVDENTGMAALVIMESPDEKKQPRIEIKDDKGKTLRKYLLPSGAHLMVEDGNEVAAGETPMDGPIDPHDILRVRGEKELQRYLVDEIQEVYRLQGVNINDKHIEVITRQMMRWVKVEDVGDTDFLIDEVVDKFRFMHENERMNQAAKKPASGHPLLLGITKAS